MARTQIYPKSSRRRFLPSERTKWTTCVHLAKREANVSDVFNCSADISTTAKSTVSKTDFQIIKVIGRGAFGKVYLVKHKLLGTYHAMKSVKKERVLQTD